MNTSDIMLSNYEKSSTPLVSVIIPFYNRTELTFRAIKSVLDQNYPAVEIIVVNDGSTDCIQNLINFLNGIDNVIYIALSVNSGPAKARNAGIEVATGLFLAFLDSDDTWAEQKLAYQVRIMLSEGWKFSHTSYWRHNTQSGRQTLKHSGVLNYFFPMPVFHCGIATPTVLVEKAALGEMRFPENIRVGEDTLLWLEMSKHFALHGIDCPLTTVYVGKNTTALNAKLRIEALSVGKQALIGYKFYLVIHAVYRVAKHLQFKLMFLFK